jgi:hypothetical protein
MVGVVGVQALHAPGGAADAAVAFGAGKQPPALARVERVRALEHRPQIGVDLGVGVQPRDPAVRLQGRDGLDVIRAGQPVEGRERVPVRVTREVPDDQRMARGTAKQDGERNRWLSPELGRDGRAIGGAGYLRFFSVARR